MIRFKLEDENNGYLAEIIELNFTDVEEFDNWVDSDFHDFSYFMEQMETGHNKWNGVHDCGGGLDGDGIEYISFSSYEIEDFKTAINLWKDYFKGRGVLITS